MEDPVTNLRMLDLAHNQLDSISDVLCKYTNLTVLYLHGNRILDLAEIDKLSCLKSLQKFSLNGCMVHLETKEGAKKVKRLEDTRYYRQRVIFNLRDTLLKSFDQVD
jgi:hypothetical protein